MIGNTGRCKDSPVEGVGPFAEGDDGRPTGTRGVVRSTQGGLGTICGGIDLIRKGNLVDTKLHVESVVRLHRK